MYIANSQRYSKMIYNRCGNSGLKLPAVSLGFWKNFGNGDGNFANMEKMVHTAFDLGITHFDLANNYGNPHNGSAEENFGKILKGMSTYRDEMIISTKAGYEMWPGPYGDRNGSRKYLTASLDQSLKRMGLDYVDENRVAAEGGSQGGALTVACAALTPDLKLAIPHFPFLSDYKRVWEMDLDVAAYGELRTYFRYYDPLHEREDEIFTKLGYIDLQHLAKRIKAEVVMSTGLMDSICPPSTQFAVYNKITSKKSVFIYPDFGHEDLKGSMDRIAKKIFMVL